MLIIVLMMTRFFPLFRAKLFTGKLGSQEISNIIPPWYTASIPVLWHIACIPVLFYRVSLNYGTVLVSLYFGTEYPCIYGPELVLTEWINSCSDTFTNITELGSITLSTCQLKHVLFLYFMLEIY